MENIIKLFRAIPIKEKKVGRVKKAVMAETIKRGFVFTKEVFANYTEKELLNIIPIIDKELGISARQMNNTFHKSWKKLVEASDEQLFIEQIIHYMTTYGFESLGIYDKDSVYIPNETLRTPKPVELNLIVIKGYTKRELKSKLIKMLESGIALSKETVKTVAELAIELKVDSYDIENIRNKEVRVMLFEYMDFIPANPTEFLRYIVYRSTDSTLLIKNDKLIDSIKENENLGILKLMERYADKYGLEQLAEIFYRFKPIFLAFRTNKPLKKVINRIRKLAVKYHKPMPEDYLNSVTAKIKRGEKIDLKELDKHLEKANTFRKVRLAYALNFRTTGSESILYKVRNGKGYATSFSFGNSAEAENIKQVVLSSIAKDMRPNLRGKKIYMPERINYALPATEKQFTGNIPSGTFVSIPKDMVVAVHWENLPKYRVDLDFSMVSVDAKYGWDSFYRSDDRAIMFSGDITDAPKPNGATEAFFVRRQENKAFLMVLNHYNFQSEENTVPFKLLIAEESPKSIERNYTINPKNVVANADSVMDQKQKVLGLLTTQKGDCRFYFSEVYLGKSITSTNSDFMNNSRQYMLDFYENPITLKDVLARAGAKFVTDPKDANVDLSLEKLEKDSIIKLLIKR